METSESAALLQKLYDLGLDLSIYSLTWLHFSVLWFLYGVGDVVLQLPALVPCCSAIPGIMGSPSGTGNSSELFILLKGFVHITQAKAI